MPPPLRSTPDILVLGMHRSGTSALTRVLAGAGAWVGDDEEMLPAHPADNPTGYWERRDIVAAHDEFLTAAGCGWDRLAHFDYAKVDDAARRDLRTRLMDILGAIETQGRPLVLKDPRLCVTLPAWLDLLPAAVPVIAVRDPREIASSIRRSHRGVFATHYLVALWEKYLRSALDALAGRRVLFVAYARLVADPANQAARILTGLRHLGVTGLADPSRELIAATIDARLARSPPRSNTLLTPGQTALYGWLERCACAAEPVPVADVPGGLGPDQTLAEYEEAAAWLKQRTRESVLAEITQRLAAVEAATEHQRTAMLTQIQLLGQQVAATGVALEQSRAEATAARAEIERLGGEIGHQHELATALERGRAAAHAAVDAMRASLSWRLTAPLRGLGALALASLHGCEQGLYRLYYALPGFDADRKRAAIVSLHQHAPWLTGRTESYRMYQLERDIEARRDHQQRCNRQSAMTAVAAMSTRPLISIVMPVHDVDPRWLHEATDSVRNQFYPHWELCIVDDASARAETRAALSAIANLRDQRIRMSRLDDNAGIAGASNAALAMASGEYVGLLDHDDVLARDALLEMARVIVADAPDLLYSDEDKLDENGGHVEPNFKPDFSPDYLLSNNYICHFLVIRRELLDRIGAFRVGFDGAQDYDLVLRASEMAHHIAHVPLVLYHWRKATNSTAGSIEAKPAAVEAGRRAVDDALARRGIRGRAQHGPFAATYTVRRTLAERPLISIIVPFRDKPDLLRACFESVLETSTYAAFELIGIDNGSTGSSTQELMRELTTRDRRIRFERYDAPFNYSAINNFGVRHARGEYLLFLNNDTRVIAPDWLEAMLEQSARPEVAVVGAKLLYEDTTIQHAGVIAGLNGVAGHAHLGLPRDYPGYFAKTQLIHNVSAVTFACAMTRRKVFDELGGLDECDLTIAFNDIDYCLRARERGYLVVYTPLAELYHYESKSRGSDFKDDATHDRFLTEVAFMQRRHATLLRDGDPYYNPNLSLLRGYEPAIDYVAGLPP